jgi:anaerobic ribonucleoside-triphosphate reductase
MRSRLQQFQHETGNHYNLEATPAEGTGYRLARLDQERFPGMKCHLQTDSRVPLYSNSTQLPVNYSEDIFQVLDLQDQLQSRYTGGTVLHCFLGEAAPDPGAVKSFVRTVCEKYELPYFTLTPSFSICINHGYIIGEIAFCPTCGCETEVYSRVVGYLRPVKQWNEGKRAEFAKRSRYRVMGK